MKLGTTFLRTDSDKHLWIVLSDPEKDHEHVLLVNTTTSLENAELLQDQGLVEF